MKNKRKIQKSANDRFIIGCAIWILFLLTLCISSFMIGWNYHKSVGHIDYKVSTVEKYGGNFVIELKSRTGRIQTLTIPESKLMDLE